MVRFVRPHVANRSGSTVRAPSLDRPLLLQLQASRCIAANRRCGPEPVTPVLSACAGKGVAWSFIYQPNVPNSRAPKAAPLPLAGSIPKIHRHLFCGSSGYLTPNEFVVQGARSTPRQAMGRDAAVTRRRPRQWNALNHFGLGEEKRGSPSRIRAPEGPAPIGQAIAWTLVADFGPRTGVSELDTSLRLATQQHHKFCALAGLRAQRLV